MITFVYSNTEFSEKTEDSKLLALFFGALSCLDCSEDFKGSVVRQVCKIDRESFVVDVLMSSVEDVTLIVNAFISQYQALKSSDENLFLFDLKVLPDGLSFNVIYKIYSSIPF